MLTIGTRKRSSPKSERLVFRSTFEGAQTHAPKREVSKMRIVLIVLGLVAAALAAPLAGIAI